jgi:protein gp37
MSRTKIEWCDYTINPIIGCKHGCSYCYARRMNDRFHFVKKWDEPEGNVDWTFKIRAIKKPSVIFMGSMTDLFGAWVSNDNIQGIMDFVCHFPQHRFLFLTKNPQRYADFDFPENCWRGATITSQKTADEIKGVDFISIEPLLTDMSDYKIKCKWVIVGGLTPKPCHKKIWIDRLIKKYSDTPIFLKNNLKYPKKLQEFPAWLNSNPR